MAVIAVVPTDAGVETVHWAIPPATVLNHTPVPRGLRSYGRSQSIAALGAGDETNIDLTLTFPTAFVYLPKSLSVQFQSDDLTTEFSNLGTVEYHPGGNSGLGTAKVYELLCNGPSFRLAIASIQVYHPMGTWRNWVRGNENDTIHVNLADISGDASAAGDFAWTAEFWEFDINQCLEWPINTPQPVLSY